MIICQIEAHIWTLISRGVLAVGLSLFSSSPPEDEMHQLCTLYEYSVYTTSITRSGMEYGALLHILRILVVNKIFRGLRAKK